MWLFLVSEFVRPAMRASPEFVRFSMWPLFHPQKNGGKMGQIEEEGKRREKRRKAGKEEGRG